MRKEIILFLFVLLILLSGCSNKDKVDNSSSDYFTRYMSDYTIKQENNDGTIVISIIAPDYESIVKNVIKTEQGKELNIENINDVAKEYPDYIKEYIFVVDELSSEKMEEAFKDKIVEELIKSAITNIEYEEGWSTEE